ncbi:MAG TPA: hypothetical protein P5561_04575, partial [Candidatus Omnitrophota bacterium]|nr:hypothetical protein [Candidatus Omnitrophota bacterium]
MERTATRTTAKTTTKTGGVSLEKEIDAFMKKVIARNPGEKEFHQAVREVVESVTPFIEKHHKY